MFSLTPKHTIFYLFLNCFWICYQSDYGWSLIFFWVVLWFHCLWSHSLQFHWCVLGACFLFNLCGLPCALCTCEILSFITSEKFSAIVSVEIWFTYHETHPFKVYSSVIFSIFHKVMQLLLQSNSRTFSPPLLYLIWAVSWLSFRQSPKKLTH